MCFIPHRIYSLLLKKLPNSNIIQNGRNSLRNTPYMSSNDFATEGKAKGKKKDTESKYSSTVLLPKTSFDQRANSLKREPEIQKFWNDKNIYENLSLNNPEEVFVLHDGPPYANGNLHIGHIG